jgi:hypothetical protein
MRQAYRNATSDAKRREIAEGYEARHGITNAHDSRHAAWYAQETRAAGSCGTEACGSRPRRGRRTRVRGHNGRFLNVFVCLLGI